jgi:hypothetical protein
VFGKILFSPSRNEKKISEVISEVIGGNLGGNLGGCLVHISSRCLLRRFSLVKFLRRRLPQRESDGLRYKMLRRRSTVFLH